MLLNQTRTKRFNNIVEEHLDSLVKFAYVKCHDRYLAEDLVQETCLKAYKSYLIKNEEIIKPKEWLFRILINTHISHLRKKSLPTIDDFDFNNSEIATDNNENTSLSFDKEILNDDLNYALGKIKPEQREIIYLVDIKGYSFKETIELLGIPLGTVTSRLHRGRQRLKTLLAELGYSKEYIRAGGNCGL